MSRRRVMLSVVALASLAGALGGCSRLDAYRWNPSPGIDTLHQRPDDVDNRLTVMSDENFRMFTQDLGRAFYTDRPSRLTPEPVPY